MKLIEGVHFHYQLRSAYVNEHRSHKPVPKYVTPLQFVCLKGKVLLTGELIKNGAYVYVKGGHMPIVSSCSLGLELMSMLMMKEKRSLKTRRKSGRRELSA